ncbi:MAG: hypothetical protein K8F27_07780, partial [Sulfuricellaceae bacterium]|nr:hypothetical protein [Sulfuricellaceae bacterium]
FMVTQKLPPCKVGQPNFLARSSFAYAKSLSVFAGAGSVQTGTIQQGQTGAGDGQWAAGINTDDGKLWLYHGGNFQAFDNYWVYLKDAQSKGF